ncbi:MAG: dienelactone hydrolase family protein [Alphaproteobacteria bacterium]
MSFVTTSTADGHVLPLFEAKPVGVPKAGVVVLHEAFGVTPHIQQMCVWLAGQGYHAVAPEMFARAEPVADKRDLPYNKEGFEQGRVYIHATPKAHWLADCNAAAAYLQGFGLPVAAVGYCWGGSLAYLMACQTPGVKAADSYYGGMIPELVATMKPNCPVQFHLATHDRYFPLDTAVNAINHHLPNAPVHVYVADHGFNRNGGITYDDEAAQLARSRTLAFLAECVR